MVATSLPFWIQRPSRVMSPFPADAALRLGATVAISERRAATSERLSRAGDHGLFVERCEALAVADYEEAWAALASRPLEPDVFLEPGFALPAIRHFAPSQRPVFLLVWRDDAAGQATLVGLCALKAPARAYGLPLSSAWTHEQATLAAPMLDRDHAPAALDALLAFMAGPSPEWSGLVLRGIAVDGPLWRLIEGGADRLAVLERRSRAVLRGAGATGEAVAARLPGHHDKELRRQRRRLRDSGSCVLRSARSPDDIRQATEQFLHLEARGWKGGRGSALLKDAGLAAFTRAMTRQLGRAGQCRIDSLEIDGRPAAMGIVLRSGSRSFFWKTAYDEQFGRYSPGKQLADMMRGLQLSDPTVTLTDSCAIPDHPMISHVWRDRMTVADVIVAPQTVPAARVDRAAKLTRCARAGRRTLKAGYALARRMLALR